MKIKVCGLTQKSQVEALAKMGVQYAGFIFYPKSPRYVLRHMTLQDIQNIRYDVQKVGVFVNENLEKVLEMVDAAGLDMVQLHGDETPAYCKTISEHAKTIKAFQVKSQAAMLVHIAEYKNSVDLFLFDTPSSKYGGTGEKFDWNAIADWDLEKEFLLSGGISPQDIEKIDTFSQFPIAKDLHALDLNSQFETEPGVKDLALLENFLKKMEERNYAE